MQIRIVTVGVAAITALALTGCVNNDIGSNTAKSSGATASVDPAAVTLLPEKIRDSGELVIGTDPTYPPNEYKDNDGNPIGWDIELANSIAGKLGLSPKYAISSFDKIIPNLKGGSYDIGVSSFIDSEEREKSVDFVNYYVSRDQWAQPLGKSVDPANACGLTVSVQATTYEETTDLPARSRKCTDAGKPAITILKFEKQDDAATALATGRADAMTADISVTQFAVKNLKDKIEFAGAPFAVSLFGIAVKKGQTGLREAIKAALESMLADGSYTKILQKWKVAGGAVKTITINNHDAAG